MTTFTSLNHTLMKLFKNIEKLFLILLGFGFLLSSCTQPAKNLDFIPKDCNFVTVFNTKTLIEKGELNKMMEDKNFQKIFSEIQTEEPESAKLLEKILKDPTYTGINFKSDVFLFLLNQLPKTNYMCLAFELKSKDKFNDFIFESNQIGCEKAIIEKNLSFSFSKIDDNFVIAWDKDKAVFIFALDDYSCEKLDFQITPLFGISKDNIITKNEEFNKFYKNRKDISVWGSSNILKNIPEYETLITNMPYNIFDIYFSANTSFNDGEILVEMNFTPNEEMKEMSKKYGTSKGKFNKKLLNYFPEKSYLLYSGATNLEGVINNWDELYGSNKAYAEFETLLGTQFKDIFASLGGSFMFSCFGFEEVYFEKQENSVTMPFMSIAFDLKNTTFLDKVVTMIPQEMLKVHPLYYEIYIPNITSIFFNFNQEICLITNDINSISEFNNGGFSSGNMNNSKFSSSIIKDPYFCFMELNSKKYPKSLNNRIDGSTRDGFLIWDNFADNIEMKYVDDSNIAIKFRTMNKNENSLKGLVKTIIAFSMLNY